jgi:surfeit locus 1 family protein
MPDAYCMSNTDRHYCFTPAWLPTLVTLLVLSLLIALGIWQLHRAEQKRVLQADYTAHSQATPLNLNRLHYTPTVDWRFYAAQVTGHFDNAHQFLLDNKFYQHQVGYQVLTPFVLTGVNKVILINRGWIAAGNKRLILPTIKPIHGELTLRGIIQIPDAKPFMLGAAADSADWPKRIEKIDWIKINALMQQNVYPLVILLAPTEPYGFVRVWAPFNGKITTHYGYAFQWFALAAALLIIFIAVNTQRKKIIEKGE